jgi:hypothetical protein
MTAPVRPRPVPLRIPKGCAGVTWRGQPLEISKAGVVKAPAEAVEDLTAHGFAPITTDDS